ENASNSFWLAFFPNTFVHLCCHFQVMFDIWTSVAYVDIRKLDQTKLLMYPDMSTKTRKKLIFYLSFSNMFTICILVLICKSFFEILSIYKTICSYIHLQTRH